MAFDGIVIANIAKELNTHLSGGRINKIAQPEKDALLLTIKCGKTTERLFLSANASLPLIYLTDKNKVSPMTAPNFCMLLRKHLNSARILSVTQPEMERIIQIEIEHLNELGDVCIKYLIVEIMGKHSNIIFCDDQYQIIDSIKHISNLVSSVREVLPGRTYFIPKTQQKQNPATISEESFINTIFAKPTSLGKAIYTSLTGFSPLMANELCYRASLDADLSANALSEMEQLHLYHNFTRMMEEVTEGQFHPNIIYKDEQPVEFSALPLTSYGDAYQVVQEDSISHVLEAYYETKELYSRMHQKSADLRKVINNILERDRKKLDLQMKQLKDTEKREKYKIYGELIHTYGYSVQEGEANMTCLNYYTNEEVTIPLDPTISPVDNGKKYFNRYAKLKRTYEALNIQTEETREEITHLESISSALDIASSNADLAQIKEELMEYGYMKRKGGSNKKRKDASVSKPLHYISSDGFHMYVGKNNFQNDTLTFKFAQGNDWWFHAKGIAGSHVVVKSNGEELPDRTFEEAGRLAGYYSKGKDQDKVEIDYTEKKNVKKPNKSKPGFVVYYTNYSLMIAPDIQGLKQIED